MCFTTQVNQQSDTFAQSPVYSNNREVAAAEMLSLPASLEANHQYK